MFAVVEFSESEGGGLSIINSKWLTPRRKQVFWPPCKEQSKFLKLLKKSDEVNTETWQLYNIARIFYETDNYDIASMKLRQAEETSDLQTDIEETRKRKKPARLLSSSDSDSNDYSDINSRKLPRPPKIFKDRFRSSHSQVPWNDTEISNNLSTLISPPTSTCTPSKLPSTSNIIVNTVHAETPPTQKILTTEKSAFEILLGHIIEIKNQNKAILASISKLEAEKPRTTLPEAIPVKFPLTNLEEINILENFLKNPNNTNVLSSYFSSLGGKDVVSKTNRILKETLYDPVAGNFNFYGRNNKQPFSRLILNSCIISAVKSSCDCTSQQVEHAIKIWLKHAPQRVNSKGVKK